MRDSRRLLWSAIVLASVGCQTVPLGSQALFGLAGGDRSTPVEQSFRLTNRSRALLGRRESPPQKSATVQTEAPVGFGLSGPWAEDDVLRMVLEHEFANASPEERQQWAARLAKASADDIPRLLADRRRGLLPDGSSNQTPLAEMADEPLATISPSVQQIILTEQRSVSETTRRMPARNSTARPKQDIDWASLRDRRNKAQPLEEAVHPLPGDESGLAAPNPPGAPTSVVGHAYMQEPEANDEPGFVANVFDMFGVGGEREAAKADATASSAIQPAGASTVASSLETAEEAAARLDLDAAKALQSVYWQETIDKLIALLEAEVSQQAPGESAVTREHYIRQHVALRMLYLIASRRPEALEAIPDVSQDHQEFWTQMFWALSSTFDDEAMPNSTLRAAETIAQLREAVRQMESRAALKLHQTVFCQQIDGFGDFVTFERDEFSASQPVLIYTEVRNFQSQSTPEGDYRTVLRSSISIRSENVNGPVVFNEDLPETEDRCRSRRQDYFHSYRIQLPATLKPGPHVLMLDVTDALTGKSGTTTMNFVVR